MESPEARPVTDVPWLFGGQGFILLLGITAVSATLQVAPLVLLAGTLLIIGLLARAWAALAPKRLLFGRRFSPARAFCGETVDLETTLTNRKALPLPWVEIWQRIPLTLPAERQGQGSALEPDTVWLGQGGTLWGHRRARWHLHLECPRRGVYPLGNAVIRYGDPFGLQEHQVEMPDTCEVVVYPRVVPLQKLALSVRRPAVDRAGARSLVADPTRTLALREYQPGDPQRLIHWPTTARRGTLHVRIPEPAARLQVTLVLDLHGFVSTLPPYRDTLLELSLSALASVAIFLHREKAPVGLVVNTTPPSRVPSGSSIGHLEAILETLARVQPRPTQAIFPWILEYLPRGSTVFLASTDIAPGLGRTIQGMEEAGHEVIPLLACANDLFVRALLGNALRVTPHCDLAAVLEGRT